jgi:D-glycero-D-manno-heptose 1,7-bisphosphate phosphatase
VSRGRRAVFLDRDGTIIEDVNYPSKPEQVRLLPGAAAAIRRLNEARIPVVAVTNQSGIARGLLTLADYERVHARMNELLNAERARIDASYLCPHHPDFTGRCECRKPGTLLFRRAADDLDLDLASSWFIGDTLRDVSPATALGGTGILVASAATSEADVRAGRAEFTVARSLDEAVDQIMESTR